MKKAIQNLWYTYKSELIFGLVLTVLLIASAWISHLIPIGLFALLIVHIRKYRLWCENNFSTLDDIDVQWIVRYVMMVTLAGLVFYWLCISHQPARAFTQQWFLMFVLAYTTERVLYRLRFAKCILTSLHPRNRYPTQQVGKRVKKMR